MKLWQFGLLCGAVVLMCGLVMHGWAADESTSIDTSNGTVGCELAKNLYQSTQNLIQGNVGLLVGLVMLLAGFWALINGAAILPAMATIIMGGLVTALPSLINVAFQSIGNAMNGSMGGATYDTKVACQAMEVKAGTCDGSKGNEVCNTGDKSMYVYGGRILQ